MAVTWKKIAYSTDAPAAHKTSHQAGGSDEISVEGLLGELTAEQKSAWAKVSGKPSTFAPEAHHASHELGGGDPVSFPQSNLHLWDIAKNPSRIIGLNISGRPVMPACGCHWWFEIAVSEKLYWDTVANQLIIQ